MPTPVPTPAQGKAPGTLRGTTLHVRLQSVLDAEVSRHLPLVGGLEVVALPFPPLLAVGSRRMTNHLDLMLVLGGDEVGIDVPAVEQVSTWENITIG